MADASKSVHVYAWDCKAGFIEVELGYVCRLLTLAAWALMEADATAAVRALIDQKQQDGSLQQLAFQQAPDDLFD